MGCKRRHGGLGLQAVLLVAVVSCVFSLSKGKDVGASSGDVVFSKDSGTYQENFTLDLSCEGMTDAQIYYTLDGSNPTNEQNASRVLYTSSGITVKDRKNDANVLSALDPNLFDAANVKVSEDGKDFETTLTAPADDAVDKCSVVKAAAKYADGTYSAVVTKTYFVGVMADHIEGLKESCSAAGMDLSVVSISMDAADLFDTKTGIYVKGDIFKEALANYLGFDGGIGGNAVDIARGLDANYKQKGRDWEKNCHVDYFESNDTKTECKLAQDCGIRIQGNYSRSDYQKSFRLYARDDYGKKNFKYGFFANARDDSGALIEKYKTLVLRNGGNCAFTTKFSDSYWQSLITEANCDTQSARPCVLYLNGEYWGVYILQDDYSDHYLENKHGVNADDVVIYKGDAEAYPELGYKLDEGSLPAGVTDESYYFKDMMDFISAHDSLENASDYDAFAKLVDVNSVMDFFALEVWMNNKWDFPGKNWSMWKTTTVDSSNPYADGKWRFLLYDVEFGGISGYEDVNTNTLRSDKLLNLDSTNKDKPNVLCFALLMTNRGFRDQFEEKLLNLSDTIFEKQNALAKCETFKNIYEPILEQFFKRFPTYWGKDIKTAEMAMNGHNGDTYGTQSSIVTFLNGRSDYIPKMVNYIKSYYGDDKTEPTPTPTATPTRTPSTQTPTIINKVKAGEVKVTLSDGTKKSVIVDDNGKITATYYTIDGVIYQLKADKTLSYSVKNKKKLKKKSSIVINDYEIAGGKRYRVTSIDAGAFWGLKRLKSVVLGENVTTIGKDAFKNCKKLKKVVLNTNKLKKVGKNALLGIAKKATISCSKGKVKKYKKLFSKKTGMKKTMKVKKRKS